MLRVCVISTCDDVCIRQIGGYISVRLEVTKNLWTRLMLINLFLSLCKYDKGMCMKLSASYQYWSTSMSLKQRYLKILRLLFYHALNFVRIRLSGQIQMYVTSLPSRTTLRSVIIQPYFTLLQITQQTNLSYLAITISFESQSEHSNSCLSKPYVSNQIPNSHEKA